MAGRLAMYPWDTWTDGRWHVAASGHDFACSMRSFRAVLAQRANAKGLRVGVRDLGRGEVAFRFLIGFEMLFSREPEVDGLRDVPRTVGGAPARYPWVAWLSGEWQLAREGEHFECTLGSFLASLRARTTPDRRLVHAVVPGSVFSIYGTATVVAFRYAKPGEDVSLIGADEALKHHRRQLSH